MPSFPVPVLGSLFVSFRPSLIHFPQLFLRCLPHALAFGLSASLPLSFVRFFSGSDYSAFCFFRSLLPGRASQGLFQCSSSSFRLPRFPPSLPSGFPCFFSGFRYLAFCSFPFILPGFAPTAVPPVLPFFSAFSRPLLSRAFRLPSSSFRPLQPASDYSASCSFFSPLPNLPWQRFLRCAPVSFVPFAFLFCPACFHAFLPIPVLSFLQFLSTSSCFRLTVATFSRGPSDFSSGLFPLAFALGSVYSACLF